MRFPISFLRRTPSQQLPSYLLLLIFLTTTALYGWSVTLFSKLRALWQHHQEQAHILPCKFSFCTHVACAGALGHHLYGQQQAHNGVWCKLTPAGYEFSRLLFSVAAAPPGVCVMWSGITSSVSLESLALACAWVSLIWHWRWMVAEWIDGMLAYNLPFHLPLTIT